MKFWVNEMSRLSLVVGVGACAGWFASGAVLTEPAAAVERHPAPIMTRAAELIPERPLLPQRAALLQAESRRVAENSDALTPAQRIHYTPAYSQKPGACSLNPRDYADDTPIGAPETPDRHKNHGVACG